jgi:hypothetical protein
MPGKNGTGPMGTGPLSGRGFGNCAGQGQGQTGQGFGRGLGQGGNGRGRGRMQQAGRRFGFNAPERSPDVTMENQELMRQNKALLSEMEAIMKRLDEMEARTAGAGSR